MDTKPHDATKRLTTTLTFRSLCAKRLMVGEQYSADERALPIEPTT